MRHREMDQPATCLNEEIMAEWPERIRPHAYEPSRVDTDLEQLGIACPTVHRPSTLQQP
jgi:aminobenzoyl-glutamate utilization protein B